MHSETQDSEYPQFVEVDPTGRYGRYAEVLGKGASKTVFRAFDEYEGIEVAWNQVKLNDFLQSPEDLERLYCEIHLLKTLKHKNIMKFYSSWVDTSKRKINFVTEMFTSGTLRQYRQKHRRVNIRPVKNWCRQILSGLLFLHSHDPPIIHRDLKCDNIFINGNQGEVKIGDLGLAAILRKPQADHCVGTPEFMAPEVYEEAYNELVDIYSFGMCVLEMVTFEYPYSECNHPAQIYKRVMSGRKPEALYKVKDPEVRQFVEKCLANVSMRLSARELLNDPFLQIDEPGLTYCEGDITTVGEILRQPSCIPLPSDGSMITCRLSSDDLPYCMMIENRWEWDAGEHYAHVFTPFHSPEDQSHADLEITINGMRRDDGNIFLSLRISDREGHVRNIYFPFDIANDTALGVAAEMVGELNITDHNVTQIAEMIHGEVSFLAPEWKPDRDIEEMSGNREQNVSSACSLLNYLSISNQGCGTSLNATSCSHVDCSLHGRFEEITYHVKELECSTSQSDDLYSSNLDEEDRLIDHTCVESSDFRDLGVENEISSSSIHKPFQASVLKTMKSFHFGTNFPYRVSSSDILQGDTTNGRSFCSGFHHQSNVLSAKAFPVDGVDVRNA